MNKNYKFDLISRLTFNSWLNKFSTSIQKLIIDESNKVEKDPSEFSDKSTIGGVETSIEGVTVFRWGTSIDDFNNNNQVLSIDLTVYSVSKSKNITKTILQGGLGSIKEHHSDNDFNISITGLLNSEIADIIPKSQVDKLVEMCNYTGVISVVNDFMNQRIEIDDIIIMDYKIKQSTKMNEQEFLINAVSL